MISRQVIMDSTKISTNNIVMDKLQNVARITLLFVLAGVPLVFIPIGGNFDQFFLPKVLVLFILDLGFFIMLLLNYKKIDNFLDNDITNKLLFIYFVLLVVSLFFTDNLIFSVLGRPDRSEGIITFIIYMTLFLIGRYSKISDEKFFTAIIFTAVIVSIYGILQYNGFDPFPRNYRTLNYGNSAFSTMGNPNFLGSYLVLMIPVTVYLYIIKKKKLGLLSYSVLLYCLLCTRTRGAWLGTMISAMCFVILHILSDRNIKNYLKRYFVIILMSIIIILLFNLLSDGALFNRFLSIIFDANELLSGGDKSDYTGSHRGFIWKRVIELIKTRPLTGYGIENLGETFNKYYSNDMIEFWGKLRYIDKTHNDFLNIAVTTGVPSMIIYLSFVFSVINKGVKNLQNNMGLLLLPSVLGYLAAIFFNISVTSVAYIYWVFLGMTVSKDQNTIQSRL
jgi:putative inorganic carbon (HCO3(-)) transporter